MRFITEKLTEDNNKKMNSPERIKEPELLISAVNADPETLLKKMKVQTDAVLVNQCGREGEKELKLSSGCFTRVYERNEKGVGRSRNLALEKAQRPLVLFSDEDIVYTDGYADKIKKAFEEETADIIFFNVKVNEARRTYWTEKRKRVFAFNCGRYPAYAAAARLSSLKKAKVSFSLLFGGGAPYSNGEDSLFFTDCIRRGLKCVARPEVIGEEISRPSTWFTGYNEKFFFDRGVLYHFLYGSAAYIWALRFVYTKKKIMCNEITPGAALKLMKKGIEKGKSL